jgi:hypothetical protein
MESTGIFEQSDVVADRLMAVIDHPLMNGSPRISSSDVACSLSLEHWSAARALLRAGILPSALVVHRAQFEALVRSIWLAYAASEEQVAKLNADLNLESEQAAKNLPQVSDMLGILERKGPQHAFEALSRFKENSWKALNSYVHAGIHPLRRHSDGYPVKLIHDVLRNTNGLGFMSCMQAVVLSGKQPLQRTLLDIAAQHSGCMPPPL